MMLRREIVYPLPWTPWTIFDGPFALDLLVLVARFIPDGFVTFVQLRLVRALPTTRFTSFSTLFGA